MIHKSRMQGPERRASIIETAVGLFAERGFRGATTRELAAAAGITEPVLYEHFATKRDLYSAIIEEKSKNGAEEFAALLGPHLDAHDDRRFFETLAHLILDFYEHNPDYIRLLLFSGLEAHDLSGLYYQRHRDKFMQTVSGYIERRMNEGALRRMDPVLAARAFTGMMGHHGLTTLLFHAGLPSPGRQETVEGMVSIFLHGLAQPCRGKKRGNHELTNA